MQLIELLAEAPLSLGKPVASRGFTFGFEAEFLLSTEWMYAGSERPLGEMLNDWSDLSAIFDTDRWNHLDVVQVWREDHGGTGDWTDVIEEIGLDAFLREVPDLETRSDYRHDADTGMLSENTLSQVDAFYKLAGNLDEEAAITNVTVFREDHARPKDPQRWYLEPDSTVDGDDPLDFDAELTSPVFTSFTAFAKQLRIVLRFIATGGGYGKGLLYTNGTCGLHVNIGIPKNRKLDLLKFVLFAGEDWLSALFPRRDDTQTAKVVGMLRDGATEAGFDALVADLNAKLRAVSDKMYTINVLPYVEGHGYVEVRAIGGANYEQRGAEILRHVTRLLAVLHIATDPNALRQVYMRKVMAAFRSGRNAPTLSVSMAMRQLRRWLVASYGKLPRLPPLDLDANTVTMTPEVFIFLVEELVRQGHPPPSALLKLIARETAITAAAIGIEATRLEQRMRGWRDATAMLDAAARIQTALTGRPPA